MIDHPDTRRVMRRDLARGASRAWTWIIAANLIALGGLLHVATAGIRVPLIVALPGWLVVGGVGAIACRVWRNDAHTRAQLAANRRAAEEGD